MKTYEINDTLSIHVDIPDVTIERDGGGCVKLSIQEIHPLLGTLVEVLGGRLASQQERRLAFDEMTFDELASDEPL